MMMWMTGERILQPTNYGKGCLLRYRVEAAAATTVAPIAEVIVALTVRRVGCTITAWRTTLWMM